MIDPIYDSLVSFEYVRYICPAFLKSLQDFHF